LLQEYAIIVDILNAYLRIMIELMMIQKFVVNERIIDVVSSDMVKKMLMPMKWQSVDECTFFYSSYTRVVAVNANYGRQVMYYANDRRAITPHET
jgi:hypothetical protein